MDYKLWEDAGFGLKNDKPEQKSNRSFFDNFGDALTAIGANFQDVRGSESLGDLREELADRTISPEQFNRLAEQYEIEYAKRQAARDKYKEAHDNLVADDSFLKNIDQMGGTLEGMAAQGIGTAVGAGLGFLTPVVGGTAVGAKVGNAAGAIAGAYLDARSVALQAQEDVLDAGGTWEQAKQAYDETLKKASLTTLPETAVDIAMGNRMVSGVLGSKAARRLAGSTIGRAGSAVLDPAARLGTKAAFASGNRLVGRGVGLATDIALQGATEAGQEVTQDYIANREAAKALGQQDNEYSLGGFKDYALSDQGLETMKTAGIMGALFGGVGGAVSSGQYLSRGAETNVGIKTHNAFNGMQNERGIKLNPQARAEQEMILSKLKGFSREELASWSDADIVAESAVAMGDMRKNITGEESDISQIREAVDTVARLSKDQNSITKEGEITEETRDLLTRMGLDEKDINGWFASPTDVLAKARQVEQEEQAKQKQAEQEGEKPKTTIKVSSETGETLNVKQGEVVQGQKPTEQTTETQEPITEKTTQNSLGEQAKQAEQQGTIQQDEEVEYPDSIIGWERDYDADNRDGVEYDSATYYSLKDNSISARIEPSGNGFTVIKVDEQGNATSDSKNKNFPSLKAAIDYLQQNKGETVFQGSDEQTQAEMPSDGVDATKGNSGTLVGSVEDLYNLSQKEPDLINPYEFAEFVRIKQHMGAGDLDIYFDRRKGYTLGEDGQWHEVNASATPAATAKGRAIIQLYKGGDLGSAIHEIAHTAYWKLSDADKRTFGYYAIKTQGKYIADSLDEDYTPEFENRLLKLASKVSQNVELDEQDEQLQEKILSKAATNQIYDNLITFYNSKMNGGAVDLKNLTPQQQRAIEERWAWEMSQWYVEGYSVGVAPSNIIQRIAQRGCESIAKDLNSLARIWQHIHHKDNNEIENIYHGGRAVQEQEQAEQQIQQEQQKATEPYQPNFTMEEGSPARYTGEPNFVMYNTRKTRDVVPYNSSVGQPRVEPYTGSRDITTQGTVAMNDTTADALAQKIFERYKEEPKMVGAALDKVFSHAKNEQEYLFAQNVAKRVLDRMNGYYGGQTQYENGVFYAGNEQKQEQTKQEPIPAEGQKVKRTRKKRTTEKTKQQQENINNLSNTKFSNPEMEARPLPQTNFTTPTLNAQPMNESVTRTNGINTGRPMYFNPINKQTLNEMNTTQQPKQEQAKEKPKPKKTTEQKPTKQEVKQETKQEQPKEQTKPTIPTDEIYSHLYFGDKTGKLKYNPKTKKIEYFVEEAGGRDPITLRKTYKLVNNGEITPEQYNELRQKYEQDFRKAKGEEKENAPDLVEGMKKEDFMYSAYKETKRTEKEKEDTTKELGKENQGLVTGKSEEYARQNAAEESFNNAMKGESLSGMEETELTKEQKKEVESSVEQELPKIEKKKTEETKKTTIKPKTTDFLSALHKKYKYVTGTPIGEKGYRFKDDEKVFIEGFKGMIDGAIGNKEELVNVAKRLDSWFQNDPTERNRMVRKYLSQYLADAAKINNNQNTEVRHQLSDKAQNVRFQAVSVKDTKALESKYEQDFLKVGKQMGYTENEISHAFILYATGNTNINIDTSKENNKAERIFVKINNKINNNLWKSGQNVQRGLDGKWRTYIDDRKATLKSGILKLLNEPNKIKGKTFYLGQIMSHLDLYKYNKKLKGVKVSFKDFGSKSNKLGQVTENGTIELNYRKMNTEKDLMSTLLHEIQHIIQKIEGFARGGNGEEFLNPRNQTLFSALTKNILNDVEKIVKFAQDNEYPLTQKQADKILNMDEFEFEKYLNENSTIGVILNDYIELKNKKFDLYKNLLGEIEARDASLRYGLDNEHYNKIKPLDLDYQYRKLKENKNNVTVRFQKSDIIKDETSNTSGFQIKSDGNIFGLNTKLSNEQVGQIQDDLMSFIEDSPSITKDTIRNLKNIYKNEISQYKRLYTISDNEDDREIATLNINNDKKKLQVVDKLLETMKDGDIIVMNNRPSNVIDITSRIKNRDSRFQKSEEGEEKKLTKKQEKKLEIQKEIKEAKEKGQTTDTYKDVYSVSFTKSAQESKVNQEKMKYFDERKSAWERHESDGKVTYTRTTPFEHHQKVITYNGINDKIVEQKPKKKYREWMDFIKEKISKNLFNDQYALYKLATDLGLGNAYMRMVVTQGYAQKTGVALEKGIMYNGKRTRAMNDIAREIGEEKQSAFCEYAIAKHLQDIYNRPNNKIEQKYDKDEVDAVIKRVEASKDYELFERCRKDLVEYNHACFHVLVDGGIITEQEFQKYVERDKNYVPLSKVMDKEDFGFNSIQFARSMVNVGSPIKKLGTSKREIKNIFGEMQRRTAIYYAAAARNKAGQIFINEICGTLDKMYDGDTVSRGASIIRKVKVKEEDGKLITRPDTDKQIFYVNNGGKHEFYQVSDPEIYRALRHLDEEQLHIINGMLEKMLSAPAGLVRATATATPDFGIRNIIRDNLTAFYTSEHGFIPIIDALWGMREIKRNGEFYQRYIDQVGEYGLKGRGELLKNNTYKLKDYRESLKDEILKEFNILTDGKRSLKDRTKALLRMTIGAPFFAFGEQLERFNMYLEQGTRVGEFKNAKMGYNGLIDRITSDLSTDINKARQSDIIAAYKAQDVTLYFSQHGLLGGKFNRFVPFLNASLLGAQKFVNAVDLAVTGKDSMNQKNTRLRKELLFKVALSTAFAIGLSAAGHGDEDYDEAPDYEKDTFWIFPNGIRIPKDEVFGRSIGTAVQRAFDQYYKEGKVDVLKTFESIAGMFKPNTVLPTVLDMFYGSIYNKDSFTGREIVPEYMTHKVGYQQKDIYTGNLAADLTEVLYKSFGINLSAKRVDWALQKNLTNAKKYLDAVYDVKEKLTDPEHFNEKMARGYDKNDSTGSFVGGLRDDVPPVLNLVTGTFATNRSQYQSVSDFQKKYKEIKQIADNDSDIPMTREQKRKWQRYEKAYKEYTKLRKQLKAIRSNASLSGADKREKAEPIFKKQIKLAEWAEG